MLCIFCYNRSFGKKVKKLKEISKILMPRLCAIPIKIQFQKPVAPSSGYRVITW